MKTMGERVRATRELRELSQWEVAERLGIYQTSYSKIERGGKTKYVVKLAAVLECDPIWLETGRGFSPFSKTLQFMSGCIQVPIIDSKKIREFLSKEK
jgi:DNA-binding XRE family transcriptional regulator